MSEKIKELRKKAEEMIAFGNSNEKAEGRGMLTVLDALTVKSELITYISSNIEKYGNFHISELGLEDEPVVGRFGDLIALGYSFFNSQCTCLLKFVGDKDYFSSDLFARYSSMDISYLENVKTVVDRWVEIKSKENG
jgi:hypothetical protein